MHVKPSVLKSHAVRDILDCDNKVIAQIVNTLLDFRISTETLRSGTTGRKPNLALPTQYGVVLSLRVTLACFAFW